MSIPRATARLQLHSGFTLLDAMEQASYYAQLGVSHLYLSPITRARPGSMHGYDVIDHSMVNPELGGEEALRKLAARLREHDMGIILDIVPNHMATDPGNAWWWDVLKHGPDSVHATTFDIDWHPGPASLRGKLLAPFLPQPYGKALSSGSIKVVFDADEQAFQIDAADARYPIAPDTLKVAGLDRQLVAKHYDGTGTDGRQRLHELLERQHYRLAWWRCAADSINWRRFFEVSELIGVCVERPEVFDAVHALPLRLYAEGLIDGLRIDHVDGMAQPVEYCHFLGAKLDELRPRRPSELRHDHPWLIVEKILAPGERLEERWRIGGTSGYDFMDQVGAVLHDAAGCVPLEKEWNRVAQDARDARAYLRAARRLMLERHFVAERKALLRILYSISQSGLDTRDWSMEAIARMLDELLVAFPVYRTYATGQGRSAHDALLVGRVLAQVRAQLNLDGNEEGAALLAWLDSCLGGSAFESTALPAVSNGHRQGIALQRFQQLTPPLAAKSLEDTTFYRYGRLLSRNEVGSDPAVFSIDAQEFHDRNMRRANHEPLSMLATATHDHKRGEDARARLAVLSEIPASWVEACERWMLWPDSGFATGSPTHSAERYMLFQTMVGAWPMALRDSDADAVNQYLQRLGQWQIKALREAKQNSSWYDPDTKHEEQEQAFLQSLMANGRNHALLRDMSQFVAAIAPAGAVNALAQTVLRITSPGVPDQYQGTEYWDFSLVDPDNRRPVDFEARSASLRSLDAGGDAHVHDLLNTWRDGRIKQAVVARALRLRASLPQLFAGGGYAALTATGAQSRHVLAFMRSLQDEHVVVVVPLACWPGSVGAGEDSRLGIAPAFWADTALQMPQRFVGARWRDVLAGTVPDIQADGSLRLADLLAALPVAVLSSTQG